MFKNENVQAILWGMLFFLLLLVLLVLSQDLSSSKFIYVDF